MKYALVSLLVFCISHTTAAGVTTLECKGELAETSAHLEKILQNTTTHWTIDIDNEKKIADLLHAGKYWGDVRFISVPAKFTPTTLRFVLDSDTYTTTTIQIMRSDLMFTAKGVSTLVSNEFSLYKGSCKKITRAKPNLI